MATQLQASPQEALKDIDADPLIEPTAFNDAAADTCADASACATARPSRAAAALIDREVEPMHSAFAFVTVAASAGRATSG